MCCGIEMRVGRLIEIGVNAPAIRGRFVTFGDRWRNEDFCLGKKRFFHVCQRGRRMHYAIDKPRAKLVLLAFNGQEEISPICCTLSTDLYTVIRAGNSSIGKAIDIDDPKHHGATF